MSRAIGDVFVKDQGVMAVPFVSAIKVDLAATPFLLLASDSVWEFLRTNVVMKAIARRLVLDGTHDLVKKLTREAQKQLSGKGGDYCDDAATVFVQLT